MRHRHALPFVLALVVLPASAQAQGSEPPPVDTETHSADDSGDGAEAPTAEVAREEEPPPNVIEANARLGQGEELFRRGDYDAALAEFERAYELIGEHPSRHLILFNIARAHERRFRYDLAMRYYRRYLDEGGPDAPRRDVVESTMSTLEGLLATIHVRVNVAEAEVWADDRQIGTAPGAVLIPGGRHMLEIRAAGYETVRREIQIAPRTEETLEVSLSALAEQFNGIDPTFFGIAIGTAGASLLAGSALGIAVVVRRGEIDQMLEDPVGRIGVGEAAQREIRNLALATDILLGSAVLLATTALIFAFLTDWGDSSDEEATGATLRPWVTASPSGAVGGAEARW